jgi:MFS family permease
MSVAVLSVFVVPMTEAFGWSRGLFSGAVSLGGICAVFISPFVGRLVDKYGTGVVIGVTSAIAGLCAMGLALVRYAWAFYALYIPGRMVFASPLELATSTALSNWFLRRRALALALLGVSQGTGLAAMPMMAQWLITMWS